MQILALEIGKNIIIVERIWKGILIQFIDTIYPFVSCLFYSALLVAATHVTVPNGVLRVNMELPKPKTAVVAAICVLVNTVNNAMTCTFAILEESSYVTTVYVAVRTLRKL